MRLINADEIPYESGEVSLGNGNYETVNIAYEGDIDAMETLDPFNVIDNLQSEIKRLDKHGKWIDEGFYASYTSEHAYRCSECGWHMLAYPEDRFRYCPSCGAKMEDEE